MIEAKVQSRKPSSENISMVIRRIAVSSAFFSSIIAFTLLSLYTFSSALFDRTERLNQVVSSNKNFLERNLKLGDYFVAQQFVQSFLKSEDLRVAGVFDSDDGRWKIQSLIENVEVSPPAEHYIWRMDRVTIGKSVPLLSKGNLTFYYEFDFPFTNWLSPFFISLLLSLIIFLVQFRGFYLVTSYFSKPIESIAGDIKVFREGGDSTLAMPMYQSSTAFKETDLLVSELVDMVAALATQNDRIQELSVFEALQLQSRQVAHDVKSPIGALNAALNFFEKDPVAASKVIRKAIGRVDQIIQDLSPSISNTELRPSARLKIDLVSLVEDIVKEKDSEYREFEKKVIFKLVVIGEKFLVPADSGDLSRAISNIINNSIEAVVSETVKIEIRIQKFAEKISIEIYDNGLGFSVSALESAARYGFTEGKSKGSGTGLAQASGVLEASGGIVKLGNWHEGAVVTLSWPSQ